MTALTLAVVMQVSIAAPSAEAAAPQSYAAAYKLAQDEGRPLMVLVGSDWCPACRQMKDSVMPQAARQGVLDRVAFAQVNPDREPGIARQLMRGGSIPQLVLYRKTADGWRLTRFVGAQSVSTIEAAIDRAVEDQTETQLTKTAATETATSEK